MAIVAAPDGSYYSNKTGKTYTREEIQAKLDEKKTQDSGSLFGSLFSGNTTTYEQTGALDNAINGYGRGVDVEGVEKSYNAHSYVETDTDRAARLREASNILGLDEIEGTNLMRGGLTDNDVMKSALALAKKKQEEPDDWEQFAADHPATVKYLEHQKNMSISYDDIKPLGKLEETANQVKTHLEMMELEEKIADLGRKYDAANMSYNELSADQRVELNDLLTKRKELAGNIDTWSIGNVLGSLLTMKEDLPMALAIGLQTGLVGAGAGAVAGGVGAIPGAMTGFGAGFKIGMGASMGYRMAGTQYAENMMRADANGQYMDAKSLRQGAQLAGAGMTILGSVGVGRLTSKLPFGQAFDKFLRTTSPSVLNNPEARQAAWKGYLSTLGAGLKEAAVQDVIFGGGTAALTYGANRYSEAWSGLDYSNREDGTLVDSIINGMQQFAPLALGTGVGFSVGGRMMSNALGKKGNTPPMPVADGLNKTMDAVNETKTAGRSKEATREAVNTIFGENASAQDVEIDARGFMRLCQEADPENPNLAVEVAQKLGVDAQTLSEAVETGDTVKVSVTDFVTEMKDSDLRSEMLKEVKDVDGVTENERGEILTHQQQVFEQNMEFIKKAANAEYDHNDPAWVAAYEATQNAYPKLKPKDLEQLTNVTYAMFKQAEERGVLELNGFVNAEEAIRAVDVRRVDAPREQAGYYSQLAGEQAYNANFEQYRKAQEMYDAGEPMEDIYDRTGWLLGGDGKWRFEIPDNLDAINWQALKSMTPDDTKKGYLGDVYKNPRLYDAYPFLKDVPIHLVDMAGDTYGQVIGNVYRRIEINKNISDEEKNKTLIHEIQHMIQKVENFGRGGSPETVREQIKKEIESIKKNLAGIPHSDEYIKANDEFLSSLGANEEKRNESSKKIEDITAKMGEYAVEKTLALSNRQKNLEEILKSGDDYYLYYNLAGEQEARAAEERAGATTDYAEVERRYRELEEKLQEEVSRQSAKDQAGFKDFRHLDELKEVQDLTEEENDRYEKYLNELDKDLLKTYDQYKIADVVLDEARAEYDQLQMPEPHNWEALVVFGGQEVDALREQADKLNQAEIRADERASADVANTTMQELFQETGKNDNVLAAIFPNAKYEGDKIVSAEQGRAIIELYKNANPSSLAHEMFHHWVFLHENAYRTGKMEGQVLQDFQKLAEFAGHELGTEWSEAEHEKLASAWETYLSEGKAPSLQLVSTFERFKNWMKRIYQTLVRHSIPINDDVRGVFDRMLASDKELEMAQKFYEAEPLFAGREMGAAELHEYAALVIASHKEAQREMDKRVMAEVNPAMKEIRDNVAANLREDIAGKMMMEPVYAARALFTAPLESADFKAAKETAIKNKIEERLDLLVKQSALGVEKKGMIAENAKDVSQEWFGGFSNNYDWYKEMFNRRGGKIPASWYRFIKAYKAGEKTLKQMPKTMREEYEYIANEQLTHGHKESMLGDIPEDIEFVNLKEGTPAMDWIVANGGGIRLDRQSIYERYGKGALPERWLTDKNGFTIDEVADFVYDGKGGGDMLFNELTTKPTFSKELAKRVRAGMAEFKDQEYGSLRESAIKAVHNAKSLEAVCVDLEIFERKQAEFKAKQEQKTADAIAEGREKQEIQNKIDRAAESAADKASKKAAREQRWLDAAVMRGQVRAKMAREQAKEQLANTPVGEVLGWQKYAALAKKAGDEAVRRMSKGDYEGAIEAKNREIMCHALAKEAIDMDKEIKSAMKYFANIDKRGNKMKGIPHEFNVQTDKIMAKYGLLSREPLQGLDGDIPLRKFLYGDKEDPNYKSVVDTYDTPFVADFIIDGDGKAYSDLTINELRDLKTSLKSLRKIGRDADKTLADGKKQSISQMVGQMVEKLGTHVQRYANESSMAESKKSPFSLNDLKKPETVLRLMDKGEENGIFVRSIFNPIKQGLDDYANRSRKVIDDVAKIMSDTGYTQREIAANKTKYYTFDFIDGKVSHERIMLLCMNYGNDGNKDRARYYLKTAAEKNKKTWSEQELAELDSRAMKMFEKLTEKDLKLVQAVWDYLNTYAEDIRRHEIECAGIDPKMVEAVPFSVMTADGKMVNMRGGYFPIRYDPNKSVRAMDLETANDLFKKNSAVQASVSHAHTKSRSQHIDRPLLLEWATFTDHLRNVNYDLAMRKPVRDVARILRRPDLQEAMAHAFGNDTVRMLNDWLRDIASDQRDMLKTSEKVLRWGRTRMSVAYLGLRTKALFIDLPQNFITAAWQNGVDSTVKGVAEFYLTGDYMEKINFVNQRSAMMRDKFSFMDANLSDLRQDFMGDVGIVGKITGGRVILPSNDKIQKLAFCVDSFSDGAVNYPTWIRYHAEAMARGLSDAEASLEADAKVRRQSVDTSKAGMAAIQRGSETLKLITPFYSYFNAYFNRLYYDYGMFRIKWADGQRVDAGKLLVRSLVLGVGLPVTIEAIMQGVVLNNDREKDKKKREENLKKEMISASFSYLANTMPVVGQLATTAVNKALDKKNTRFELSPVESAFNTITDTAGAIAKFSASNGDAEAERKLVEAMAKAAAITMPYPNMLNTFALNIWDIFAKGGDITLADIVTRRRNQK